MSPRPCLEPTSPSGPGANPPTSGFGSRPRRTGQSAGRQTRRNVWQAKCRCSAGQGANRGCLSGGDLLILRGASSRGIRASGEETGWAGRRHSGWGSVRWTPGWDPQLSSSDRVGRPAALRPRVCPVDPGLGPPAQLLRPFDSTCVSLLPGRPSWYVKGALGSQGAAEGTCGRGGGHCSLMARSPPEPSGLNSSTPPGKGGLRLGVLTSSPCKCPLSLPSLTPSCFANVKPGFVYVGRTRNTCGAARTART